MMGHTVRSSTNASLRIHANRDGSYQITLSGTGSQFRVLEASEGMGDFDSGCVPHKSLRRTDRFVPSHCGEISFVGVWATGYDTVWRSPVYTTKVPCTFKTPRRDRHPAINTSLVIQNFGKQWNHRSIWIPESESEILDGWDESYRIGGSLHSWGADSAPTTEGRLMWTNRLKSIDRIDADTLRIQCGVTVVEVEDFLRDNHLDRMFRSLPVIPDVTVCGALATGSHDTGVPSMPNDVVRMRVLPKGTKTPIVLTRSDPRFARWVQSNGQEGVVLNMDLRLIPLRRLVTTYRYTESIQTALDTIRQPGSFGRLIANRRGILIQHFQWTDMDTPINSYQNTPLFDLHDFLLNKLMTLPLYPITRAFWVNVLEPVYWNVLKTILPSGIEVSDPRTTLHTVPHSKFRHRECEVFVRLSDVPETMRTIWDTTYGEFKSVYPLVLRTIQRDEIPVTRSCFKDEDRVSVSVLAYLGQIKFLIEESNSAGPDFQGFVHEVYQQLRSKGIDTCYHPGKIGGDVPPTERQEV